MRPALAIAALVIVASSASLATAVPNPLPPLPRVLPCACFSALAVGVAEYESVNWITDEACSGTVAIAVHVAFHELRLEMGGNSCLPDSFWGFLCEVDEDGAHTCVEVDGPQYGVATLSASGEFHFLAGGPDFPHQSIDGQLARVY